MSQVRLDFLNWNPDTEDTENKGLTIATNVVHDAEGYKQIRLQSAGAFSTTGGLGASNGTVISLIAKQIGHSNDRLCAWLTRAGGLNIGLNGVTATSPTTGYPLSSGTASASGEITVFDVCEYAGKITFTVEAQQVQSSPSATATLRHSGYLDY